MAPSAVVAAPRVLDRLTTTPNELLDQLADQLQAVLHRAVERGGRDAQRGKAWLNGVWLGHPLHPALTDVTLGAWGSSAVLDLAGASDAADALLIAGLLSAIPTALAGAADWSDSSGAPRRGGLVHALLNSGALTLYAGSLVARRTDRRGIGLALSTCGLAMTGASAWLGGHLVFSQGANVNRAAFEPLVEDFTVALREADLTAGTPVRADVELNGHTTPVVLLKTGSQIFAIGDTCTHWGGSLADGKVVDGTCISCPLHASVFSMVDGTVRDSPASVPAQAFETRVRDGNVEIRRRT